ncbi:MAG: MarR family winged helix-turn-helix transcriptional regulator [Candidatus Eiseniibacteriota bacterium]|jgi:DNA-binding MarR family transcriptional regulator
MATPLTSEDQIVAAIRRIMRAVDLHSRWLYDEFGLTGPQLAALQEAARLVRAPAGALARALHLSAPTVTGILDRLEKKGLVDRTRATRDRRSVIVRVTALGHETLEVAPSLLQDRFRTQLARLAEWERSMILATLQRIAAMMDVEDLAADPVLVTGPVGAESPPAGAGSTSSEMEMAGPEAADVGARDVSSIDASGDLGEEAFPSSSGGCAILDEESQG